MNSKMQNKSFLILTFSVVILCFGIFLHRKPRVQNKFLFSCSNQQTGLTSENDTVYKIDLDMEKEEFIPLSSIFKRVKTIILETGIDCAIGIVSDLQVFDGCIYILDQGLAKSLFVFDMQGRFIRKIGNLGRGPGEYNIIRDFTIDAENKFIFLQDQGTLIHKYHLDGTYVHSFTIQIPSSNSYFIQSYNGRLYSSITPSKNIQTQDDYMLFEIDPNDGKIISRSLPIKLNKGWTKAIFTGNFFMSRLNNPPRYTQLFMDHVVSLDEEISTYIKLMSRYLVTERDLENLQQTSSTNAVSTNVMGNEFEYFQRNSKIWNVHSFIENNDFIIFNYIFGGVLNIFTVVFHKETRAVKITNNIINDLVFNSKRNMFGLIKFSDMQGAYEVIPTFVIDRFLEFI